jgi:hypothetical protein
MNELILFLLAVVGVFSIACSYALITLGKMVDEFPLGDETTRTRGITSPAETTKIAVVLFWILFLPGAWAVLQEGIVIVIVGITILVAICLFMLTAMVFSFSVLSAMSRRKNDNSDALRGVSRQSPAGRDLSSRAPMEPATNSTPQKKSLSKGIVHALLKK